jgi:hypothetical protein
MRESRIIVRRGFGGYRDHRRSYKVLVDGVTVGKLRPDEYLEYAVSPGSHSVQIRIDWSGSKKLFVNVEPEQTVLFGCWGKSAHTSLLDVFSRTRWVKLTQIE